MDLTPPFLIVTCLTIVAVDLNLQFDRSLRILASVLTFFSLGGKLGGGTILPMFWKGFQSKIPNFGCAAIFR